MIATITNIKQYNDRDFLFTFDCAEIAQKAIPGQFAEIRVSKAHDPFLRRPFSIYDTDGGAVRFLVRVVGKGTQHMSGWNVGDSADILGPLGNSFSWNEKDTDLILVAGGSGFAPINFLARKLALTNKRAHLLYFYSNECESSIADHLKPCDSLSITLSHDRTGESVKPLLQRIITNVESANMIYACGPESMMKVVAETGAGYNIPAQLSMEAVMGCGINICSCCVIPVKNKDGSAYKKVCSDGPVFSGEEIVFSE